MLVNGTVIYNHRRREKYANTFNEGRDSHVDGVVGTLRDF